MTSRHIKDINKSYKKQQNKNEWRKNGCWHGVVAVERSRHRWTIADKKRSCCWEGRSHCVRRAV